MTILTPLANELYARYFGPVPGMLAYRDDVSTFRTARGGQCLGECLVHRGPPIIRIAALDPEMERKVLLHELIHAHLHVIGEPDAMQHGPLFLMHVNRLQALGEGWCMPTS